MAKQYYIDRAKFNKALTDNGFRTALEFASRAGIHRNSIGQYLSHEQGVFTDLFVRICENLKISDPLALISFQADRTGTLNEARLTAVLESLAKRESDLSFVLIGSRASGKAHENSDWDVGVTAGSKGLSSDLYLKLKSQLDDLTDDFAQSCDLVNLDAAPPWFLRELDCDPKFLVGSRELSVLKRINRWSQKS